MKKNPIESVRRVHKPPDPAALAEYADRLLERCARQRTSLNETLRRFLKQIAPRLKSSAALVIIENEFCSEEQITWKLPDDAPLPAKLQGRRVRRFRVADRLWIRHPLSVDGILLGNLVFVFEPQVEDSPDLLRCISAVAEQLDGILWYVLAARRKQSLLEQVTRALTLRDFRKGLRQAVRLLHRAVRFDELILMFRDDADRMGNTIDYFVFRETRCRYDSENRPWPVLDRLLDESGPAVLEPDHPGLSRLEQANGSMESLLINGIQQQDLLGKMMIASPRGIGIFGWDLFQVFSNVLTQRLVDYNRERRHLAHFFPPKIVRSLLADPDYYRHFLRPRQKSVVLFYADLNSFTSFCENSVSEPEIITEFINAWSTAAVSALMRHGGTFDKMVGDCIIGIFGPPYYRASTAELSWAALQTARDLVRLSDELIQCHWRRVLQCDPDHAYPGVSIAINQCEVAVGFYGPSRDFTAFGTGMNETARLEQIAGRREILLMDSVYQSVEPRLSELPACSFAGPFKETVRHLKNPLVYYRMQDSTSDPEDAQT